MIEIIEICKSKYEKIASYLDLFISSSFIIMFVALQSCWYYLASPLCSYK